MAYADGHRRDRLGSGWTDSGQASEGRGVSKQDRPPARLRGPVLGGPSVSVR